MNQARLRKSLIYASAACFTYSLVGTGSALAQGLQSIDEIIVTARKREEGLQTVPVAVSAVTASTIEDLGIQDLADISKITAGLIFDNEFSRNSNRPVIRGQANILGDSGVAYFIDGVYITGSIAEYDLSDVERIEVVKGPQSALYGRNTYSGAINVISKSPGETLSGDVKLEVTSDSAYEVSASARGPLFGDQVGGGITVRRYESDGPFTNTFDGSDIGKQESTSISGMLQFDPADNLTIRARAYYSDVDDGQSALFHQSSTQNNCFQDNGALYGGLGRFFCGTVVEQNINTDVSIQAPDARLEMERLQTSLAIDYEMNDQWSLTSITGYNKLDSIDISDGDYQPTSFQTAVFTPGGFPFAGFPTPPFSYGYVGTVVDFTFANEQIQDDISQEFRVAFEGENVDFLFGAYYFDQDDDNGSIRNLPPNAAALAGANFGAAFGEQAALCAANPICESIVPFFGPTIDVSRSTNSLNIENKALFGLVSFDVSEAVGLTFEARYQEEDVSQVVINRSLGGAPGAPVVSNASFESFSPRATIDWQVNDNSLLYAVYAEGTKPGGFNGAVAILAGLPTFEEEEVSSIELGSKNVFLDGQLVANFSLYFNEVDGYQLTQNARAGANTTSATVNAGDADINGLEAELQWRPAGAEGFTATLNYAYTDAEFSRGLDENEGLLLDAADNNLVDCSTGDQFPNVDGCTSLFGSIAGRQVPRTAEHQAYFDLEMRRPFGDGWEWFVGGNVAYESSKFAQVLNLAETGDTTLVNARFGVSNDRYGLNVWGKNIGNEDSTPTVLRYADGDGSFRRSFVGSQRREAYYGVIATVRF